MEYVGNLGNRQLHVGEIFAHQRNCVLVNQVHNVRPKIKGDAKVEDYDVIFIGYSIRWGEPPMALFTFIENCDEQCYFISANLLPACVSRQSADRCRLVQ